MRTVQLAWLLAFIATCGAQKSSKAAKYAQSAQVSSQYSGQSAGPRYQAVQAEQQYSYAPNGQSSHINGGHGGHAHGAYSAVASKPHHALLLSDSRTLNHDGTINFQYAADNGLQQGESVDADGTRRGFYSYPGADGKPITVKYTAGKNGFQAEGDHLPKQPNVPAHSPKDEIEAKGHDGRYGGHGGQGGHGGGHGGHGGSHAVVHGGHGGHSGAHYGNQAGPSPAYQPAHSGSNEYRPKPYAGGGGRGHGSHYSKPHQSPALHQSSGSHGHGHGGQDGFAGFGGFPGASSTGSGAFKDFGPVNYGAPSQGAQSYASSPQTNYASHALPSGGEGFGRGPVHSVNNPYQAGGGAGPYSGNFDLGNGGQFSIDFNPGKPQEVPVGGDYSGHLRGQERRY